MKLLCTDLDRTLLPNGEHPESLLARPILWKLLDTRSIQLAYVTGRELGCVLDAIQYYGLKTPDCIAADVGSSIYFHSGNGWVESTAWKSQIAIDWNGRNSEYIRGCLRGIEGLKEQEPSCQRPFKCSYYIARHAQREDLSATIYQRMNEENLQVSVVMSDDPEKGIGLLDVLPRHATKAEAVGFIQQKLGTIIGDTLFAGDSGNDVTALASSVPSVIVANADQRSRDAAQSLARSNATQHNTYQATGGLVIAEGVSLNGNYAAGIVEGFMHFRKNWHADILSKDWLADAVLQYPPGPG